MGVPIILQSRHRWVQLGFTYPSYSEYIYNITDGALCCK